MTLIRIGGVCIGGVVCVCVGGFGIVCVCVGGFGIVCVWVGGFGVVLGGAVGQVLGRPPLGGIASRFDEPKPVTAKTVAKTVERENAAHIVVRNMDLPCENEGSLGPGSSRERDEARWTVFAYARGVPIREIDDDQPESGWRHH